MDEFVFQYGQNHVRCLLVSDPAGRRWYYQVNRGPETPGPVWSQDDTEESVRLAIREIYKSRRDPGEPVTGHALYKLAPGLVNMEPHPSAHAWLQPGRCFEGHPD